MRPGRASIFRGRHALATLAVLSAFAAGASAAEHSYAEPTFLTAESGVVDYWPTVSPETGYEVGEGETGLIRVFDLANVYSVMAVQTEDLGIHGRDDGFVLAGRALSAEPRGCSLLAV